MGAGTKKQTLGTSASPQDGRDHGGGGGTRVGGGRSRGRSSAKVDSPRLPALVKHAGGTTEHTVAQGAGQGSGEGPALHLPKI